jgi:alkylation response protein AidB-like acyl-CoA dehydrogenase
MAELGLFGICVPEALGGPSFDTLTYALIMEELSRGYSSVSDQCGLVELISTLLVQHGTAAQQVAGLALCYALKKKWPIALPKQRPAPTSQVYGRWLYPETMDGD